MPSCNSNTDGRAAEQSIRPLLETLEHAGELLRIDKPVSREFEISAFLSAADAGPAVLFEHVLTDPAAAQDSKALLRVAGNLLNSRERVATALGIAPRDILPRLLEAIRTPLPTVEVTRIAAPVQEVIVGTAPLDALPVPRFFEREARSYITAGTIIARDPETGRGNLSFARLAVLDGSTAMIGIAPNHHLALFARRAAALERPLEIAVVIGAHPAIQLAACLYLGVGDDELECAGRLLGEPVRVVRAHSVDLQVPAEAELVLEGRIYPDVPIEEGVVSEYHGLYESYGAGLRVSFSALTHRHDALLQVIEPGYHREHIYLGALPIAAGLWQALRAVAANVADVAVTEAGAGRTDVVVAVITPKPGQSRRLMFAVFAAVNIVKRVTVVDADIDPWDSAQVEWARCTRVRWERDVLLVPGAGADRSEPQESAGLITKIGIDATAKNGDRAEGNERALPPVAVRDNVKAWLTSQLPAAQRQWLK